MPVLSCSFYKIYDIVLTISLAVFFAGYLNIHAPAVGLPHLFPISPEIMEFWEIFTWIIFAALGFDIYLKYQRAGSLRIFLKKHWLELAMIGMIPLFAGLKLAKISVKLVKGLKMMKSGFKVAHGAKKMSKG